VIAPSWLRRARRLHTAQTATQARSAPAVIFTVRALTWLSLIDGVGVRRQLPDVLRTACGRAANPRWLRSSRCCTGLPAQPNLYQQQPTSPDVRSALDYMKRECAIGDFDRGPLSEIAAWFGAGHEDVFTSVKSTLVKMEQILDASKREMSRSAKYYETTDQGEASKLDATYPASKR
jgi:hypothetical protein